MMKQYWQGSSEWYNRRNLRERILIAAVTGTAVISLWLALISDPQGMQRQKLQVQVQNMQQQHQALQGQIATIKQQASHDPDELHRQRIAQLKNTIQGTDKKLREKMHGFIDPNRMASVLQDVLKQKSRLKLTQLKSLVAEPIVVGPQATEDASAEMAGIFKHGFEIQLNGSYLHTLAYLNALEKLPWDFYWDAIEVEVLKYPTARITLRLHTLSLKEGWIGV